MAGLPLHLSIAIISKDEESNIRRCLQSAAGLAREIVVLDSGSTDGTCAVAREFGARVQQARCGEESRSVIRTIGEY